MAKFGRRRRGVYVQELGREVRIRGLSSADLDELPDAPDPMPEEIDPRHPVILAFVCAGVVSPKLTRDQAAELSVDSLRRLQRAIHDADPYMRRLAREIKEENDG